MNRFLLCICTFLVFNISVAQEINQVSIDARGREKILGTITKEGLSSNSFNSWFSKNYEAYKPDATIIKDLKKKLKKYKIKVFMGTWCGDSKKEVPRLYKILAEANFPEYKLKVIGLDNTRKSYKQGPNGEEKGLNIHRVPTIIVYSMKGKEIGRIVEHPVESLEADLLQICKKKKYEHNYQIVTQLNRLFSKKGVEYVVSKSEKVVEKLKPFSKSLKELNTYGYVLLRAKKMDQAIAAFALNTKLFPENKNSYDSLGEAYYFVGNYPEAIKNYNKVLELDTSDANAKEMLAKMNK